MASRKAGLLGGGGTGDGRGVRVGEVVRKLIFSNALWEVVFFLTARV